MNILTKYILSPLIIMMSVQAFAYHAVATDELFEFSSLAKQMIVRARLLVDPTYRLSLEDSEDFQVVASMSKVNKFLIEQIADAEIKICEMRRGEEKRVYTSFSLNDLNSFLARAEESIRELIYCADDQDHREARSELMISVMQTLKTMEPELFNYCFKSIYFKMYALLLPINDSFFYAYDLYPSKRKES